MIYIHRPDIATLAALNDVYAAVFTGNSPVNVLNVFFALYHVLPSLITFAR
jgi:hypothetical protein